jgi:DNA-binding XRE family transcriptional regulator
MYHSRKRRSPSLQTIRFENVPWYERIGFGEPPRRYVMATSVRVETISAAAIATSGAVSTNGTSTEAAERPVIRCERCRLVQFRASHNRCRRCLMPFVMAAPPPPEPVVETESHPNIAAGVRAWRQQRGLTQKQLAFAAHLPRTYISRIENGRILPGLSTLERVAIALHIGLPALFDRRGRSYSCASNGTSSASYSNGNGHSNGNGNGHSNGNGFSGLVESGMAVVNDSDAFLRQMVRYCRRLTDVQRATVIQRVKELVSR